VINLPALFTLSEIAITMIGLSGLVAIFLSKGSLQPADRLRFYVILVLGIIAALLGYVPYWVSNYVTDALLVWKYSSIFALLLVITSLTVPVLFFMIKDAAIDLRLIQTKSILIASLIPPLVILTMLLINALSWPINANSTLYELALFFMIVRMTVNFGSLVLFRARTPADTEEV